MRPGPGTNPLAVSPAFSYLWAPVVKVGNATNQDAAANRLIYTYLYTTLIQIEDSQSEIVATRLVSSLFAVHDQTTGSEQATAYGCFAAIIGKASQHYDEQYTRCSQRSIYLLGASGNGMQLARVSLQDVSKSEEAYEFWQPQSCNFTLAGDTLSLSDSSSSYLRGSFSSGSVFYSPFFETFLMIYMNADADSTFYLRYLDLDRLSCTGNSSVWQEGGINAKGITGEDAEAIIHYEWSEPQTMFVTPASTTSTLRYSYAGVAHPEFFSRYYWQPWMYSNDGIDSTMKSPWLGGEVITEAGSGGDGKHLMISWTVQGEKGYDIVMAKVEFGKAREICSGPHGITVLAIAILAVCVLLLL